MSTSEQSEIQIHSLSHTYKPGPPLSYLVDLIWYYDSYNPPHNQERMLPTGTMEMVFDLRGGDAVVSGSHSKSAILDTAQSMSVIGVHFKPGGALPFFKLPMDELRNLNVPLQVMWGNLACDISDRLAGAKTLQMRFEIIERALLANANRQLNRHPAVEFALNRFELPARSGSIAQVTEKVGLSSRWFIEQFKSEVGLTPKLYSRVRRFQRSLRLIETARAIDWAEIALDCGYYDQAHFIHDFQAFANTNPSDYLRSKGEHLNHLPLP